MRRVLGSPPDIGTSEGRSVVQKALRDCFAGAEPAHCVQRSLAALQEVSAILDAKATDGNNRLWIYDASFLRAFALALEEA